MQYFIKICDVDLWCCDLALWPTFVNILLHYEVRRMPITASLWNHDKVLIHLMTQWRWPLTCGTERTAGSSQLMPHVPDKGSCLYYRSFFEFSGTHKQENGTFAIPESWCQTINLVIEISVKLSFWPNFFHGPLQDTVWSFNKPRHCLKADNSNIFQDWMFYIQISVPIIK